MYDGVLCIFELLLKLLLKKILFLVLLFSNKYY